MDQLIQTLIIGLANGLIFALVALGYTLVYGIIELINFAHGDVFMLGSMLAFFLIAPASAGAGHLPDHGRHAVPLDDRRDPGGRSRSAWLVMAVLNVAIERIAYRPLRNAPKLAPLISAIGVSYVLQNVGLVCGGAYQRTHRQRLPDDQPARAVRDHDHRDHLVAGLRRRRDDPAARSPCRCSSAGPARARRCARRRRTPTPPGLMGVDVNRTIAITFLIGGALAGAAGVAQILYNDYTVYTLGFRFGLNSFTAAVLGGIGNLQGAVLGALSSARSTPSVTGTSRRTGRRRSCSAS